jgi:hypothetical protein
MASPAVKEKGLFIQTRISSIFEFFGSLEILDTPSTRET